MAHHGNFLIFDPLSDIYSCLVSLGKKRYSVGTYFPSIEYKEHSLITRNIDTIPKCRECIYSLLCGGGCAMPLSSSGDIFQPVCESIRYQIHDLIPKLVEGS